MRGRHMVGLISLITASAASRADQAYTLIPAEDTFVRELAPNSGYGAAGSLCVAGPASVNGSNQPRGRFDALLKLDTRDAFYTFNAAYGTGRWTITALTVFAYEQGTPTNSTYPRGPGSLVINWFPDNDWSEGSGTPASPEPGSGNIMTWSLLQTRLGQVGETPLGTFTGLGADGQRQFSVSLPGELRAHLEAGDTVTLHAVPVTPTLGFTFNSRSFPSQPQQLHVALTAALRADVTCDDRLDESDVDAFVLALLDPAAYAAAHPDCDIRRADLNQDSVVDGSDIGLFVAALLGG